MAESKKRSPFDVVFDFVKAPVLFVWKCIKKGGSGFKATILISLVLLIVKTCFRDSHAVKSINSAFFYIAQPHLGNAGIEGDGLLSMPAVVNISHVPQSGPGLETDREALQKIVDDLISAGASAVAIDVDFSPEDGKYAGKDDPAFFANMLDASVPIVLGVGRSVPAGRRDWLGSLMYADLAGALTMTPDRVDHVWAEVDGPNGACPTLPNRLLQRSGRQIVHPHVPRLLAPFVEAERESEISGDFKGLGYAVDYSRLPDIERGVIDERSISQADVRKRLKGRLILMGDFSRLDKDDGFTVPGYSGNHPGVIVHACSVYTLLHGPPLEPTLLGSWLLDILFVLLTIALSAAFLGAVASLRNLRILIGSRNRSNPPRAFVTPAEADERLSAGSTVLSLGLSILLCATMVHSWRILWDDFFVFLIVFLLHFPLHTLMNRRKEEKQDGAA